jgi:hypothetical protein
MGRTIFIAFALVGLSWLAELFRKTTSKNGRMAIKDTIRLDAHNTLYLVEVDGKEMVFGAGSDGNFKQVPFTTSPFAAKQQEAVDAEFVETTPIDIDMNDDNRTVAP